MNQRQYANNESNSAEWILGLVALFGLLCFLLLYGGLYPWAGRKSSMDKKQISKIARETIAAYNFDVTNFREKIELRGDQLQISYLQGRFGTAQANRLMREAIPAYFWQVEWTPPGAVERALQRGGSEGNLAQSRLVVNSISVKISENGRVLSMNTSLGLDSTGPELFPEQVRPIADKVLRDNVGEGIDRFKNLGSRSQRYDNRLDHNFRWQDEELAAGEVVEFTVDIAGDQVSSFGFIYHVPEEHVKDDILETIIVFPFVLMFIFLAILLFVMLIKKLRSDEIAMSPGLPFGITAALAVVIIILLPGQQKSIANIVLPIVVAGPIVGFALTLVVSTSDVVAREVWPNKLLALDALRNRRIVHVYCGKAIVRGYILAGLALGLVTLLLKAGGLLFPLYFLNQGNSVSETIALVPALFKIAEVLFHTFFLQFTLVLFLVSYFAQRFTHRRWIAAAVVLIWGVGMSGIGHFTVSPFFLTVLVEVVIALLFVLAFLRYDFLTTLVGYFIFTLFYESFPMLLSSNSFLFLNGFALLLSILFLGFFGLLAQRKTMSESEITRFEPSYVHRVNERMRIQRELEIARDVQLSFLPRLMPKIEGLDIATICIPATEVGGDYYDFVDLGDNKLGIAIGDVSGKGISAAFYMTLTKGFFRSQAKLLESPKDVLIKINQLFYENVERGHFISMIYGVIDMKKRTFTFARAGHNPVIVRRGAGGKSEILCPDGMALGLERGDLFNQVIEERRIKLKRDDFFILYTDGFTEAMDSQQYEFGEERLYKLVEDEKGVLAHELTDIVVRKIQSFVGKTPQHDDMTMVILHVI